MRTNELIKEIQKMNKLHKKQVIAGLKDAKEGKVMDSATFWKKLCTGSLSSVKNQPKYSTCHLKKGYFRLLAETSPN